MALTAQAKHVKRDVRRKKTSIGRKATRGNKHNRRKRYRGQGWI